MCLHVTPTAQWWGLGAEGWQEDLEFLGTRIVSAAPLMPSLQLCPLSLRSDTKYLLVTENLFKKITEQNNPQYKDITSFVVKYLSFDKF